MFAEWAFLTTPQILNDDTFVMYGGSTGTSVQAQRNAAYIMAEQEAALYLGTFLTATTVTGTFAVRNGQKRIQLPHLRVRSVASVTAIYDSGCDCENGAIELSACAWVVDGDHGVIDITECNSAASSSPACSNCGGDTAGVAKEYRIVYDAGLSDGVIASNPSALMGLVTAADLALQQIIDPSGAEGGAGDVGVQSFSDSGYSENRTRLKSTPFGTSARANYAAKCLAPFRIQKALSL